MIEVRAIIFPEAMIDAIVAKHTQDHQRRLMEGDGTSAPGGLLTAASVGLFEDEPLDSLRAKVAREWHRFRID
jgi:hypothetical protein